jgi:hypothetical protein
MTTRSWNVFATSDGTSASATASASASSGKA